MMAERHAPGRARARSLTTRYLRAAAAASAILAGFVLFVALFPIPHSFSLGTYAGPLTVGSVPQPAWLRPPGGSSVQGSWATSTAVSVDFYIEDASSTIVYSSTSSTGSFHFTANDPPYAFYAMWGSDSETVTITGTYYCPLLSSSF